MSKNNNNNISQFLNQKYINIETYRNNGEAVQTPVWFVIDGEQYVLELISNLGR